MSVGQSRLCLLVTRCSPLLVRQPSIVAPANVVGHKHLTTKPNYKKPYPYKEKSFGFFRAMFEYTSARLNENSRILLVEGPPCVGKSEFAKNLADNFKLKYMPPITEDDLFTHNGLDIRQLNELMPTEKMKVYDLDMFYSEPDPKNMLHIGGTQMLFFKHRFYQYIEALKHVLHTGQGVVLENSVWSDACYAMNMAEHGYFTKKGIKWLLEFEEHARRTLWKPHLIIHLDAPSSLVVQRMKEKYPKYANSPVLRESYFDGLRDKFVNTYIPHMSKYCDTLYYDVTQMEDFDLLAMDLESMDLISARFAEGVKFMDWRLEKEEQWSMYRVYVSDKKRVNLALKWRLPYNCPELTLSGEELVMMFSILERFPQLTYSPSYWHDKDGNFIANPELGDVTPLSLMSETPLGQSLKQTKKIASA